MFNAPIVALQGHVVSMPDGMPGVDFTIRTMRRMVKAYKMDLMLRNVAIGIIYTTPSKDDLAEISALYEYVRDGIRYTRDVHGVETVSTPDKVLLARYGDCDDKSLLLATLLESVGYPTRFVVTGYGVPGEVEHVYVQTLAYGNWIDLDTTENYDIGIAPPNPTTRLIERI